MGPLNVIMGPGGRQRVPHESEAGFSSRCRDCSRAHGWASDDVKSESNFVPACHSPERSGFPSDARGAGADRFGLPSVVRGMPGVFSVNHCAELADERRRVAASATVDVRRGCCVIESLAGMAGSVTLFASRSGFHHQLPSLAGLKASTVPHAHLAPQGARRPDLPGILA